MCTGAELVAAAQIAGAGAAVVGTATAIDSARRAKNQAGDAARERQQAEAQAAQSASAQTQMARKALRDNSLFTGGGDAGRSTLGV